MFVMVAGGCFDVEDTPRSESYVRFTPDTIVKLLLRSPANSDSVV